MNHTNDEYELQNILRLQIREDNLSLFDSQGSIEPNQWFGGSQPTGSVVHGDSSF